MSSQNRELFCDCTVCEFGHTGKMMRMCSGDNNSSKRDAYREMLARPPCEPRDHVEVMREMETREERTAYRESLKGG